LVTGDAGFVGQHVLAQIPRCVGFSGLCPGIDILDRAALIACLETGAPAPLTAGNIDVTPDFTDVRAYEMLPATRANGEV
jgi:hypothetical protein